MKYKDRSNMEYLMSAITERYHLDIDTIIGHSRRKEYVEARFIAYAVLRRAGYSYPSIANIFTRDHTSIIYGVKVAEQKYGEILGTFDISRPKVESITTKQIGGSPFTQFSKKWQSVYDAWGGKCAVCGFSEVVMVHHIHPRCLGGGDGPTNVILLCPNHHGMMHLGLVHIEKLTNSPFHKITLL